MKYIPLVISITVATIGILVGAASAQSVDQLNPSREQSPLGGQKSIVAISDDVGPVPSSPKNARPEKLTITVDDVLIRIDGPKLWTLSGVDYQKSPVAVQESAYGSVLNIKGVGILGSAHFLDVPGKPGKVEKEDVTLVESFLDDQAVTELSPVTNLTGKSFRMHRKSKIRAVHLTSSIDLRDGVLLESVRMQTSEAVDLKVSYPLMYAWSPLMTHYVFGNDSGVQKRGVFLGESGKPSEGLEKNSSWMAVYDSKLQKGAVLLLVQQPKTEETWLQFTDAPGVYRKLRLMSFSEKTMPAGFDGTFQSAVGFFTGNTNEWETRAVERVRELQSLITKRLKSVPD